MGLRYIVYLSSDRIYTCKQCRTHLTNHNDLVSKQFRGQHGAAFLFDAVVNVAQGSIEQRRMTTGEHRVRDVKCAQCGSYVGWKYEWAEPPSEQYKIGKFILEAELIVLVSK
ncbi:hypothetical protein CANCADRAFT_32767 [Tortispora caseinolytica NRRL Y-17796]|uniref:Protein yippee-like n=1 Tax=Tortispora caseinolytica NRRL Y-17796 TaxID=767744 RepID=A0A1E4TCQ2_9ASCO|nr:hypothetical protein CANCADRAFT_32767 [Tortispora caseinolytica NRRL Y-17796]